jgi:hypothetical protein
VLLSQSSRLISTVFGKNGAFKPFLFSLKKKQYIYIHTHTHYHGLKNRIKKYILLKLLLDEFLHEK